MRRIIEVWFYIGTMLAAYGVTLTAAGVYQWVHPPPTVLAEKHATFWIGLSLMVIGMIYAMLYWPKPGTAAPHDGSRLEGGQ